MFLFTDEDTKTKEPDINELREKRLQFLDKKQP